MAKIDLVAVQPYKGRAAGDAFKTSLKKSRGLVAQGIAAPAKKVPAKKAAARKAPAKKAAGYSTRALKAKK